MEKISLKKRRIIYGSALAVFRKYTAMKYTTTLEAAMGKICQAALLLIRHSLTHIQPKYRTPKSIHTACFSSGRFAAGVGINSALVMLEKFSNQSSALAKRISLKSI
jgi:hypothetical protein